MAFLIIFGLLKQPVSISHYNSLLSEQSIVFPSRSLVLVNNKSPFPPNAYLVDGNFNQVQTLSTATGSVCT